MTNKNLIVYICVACDQGHRAAWNKGQHPVENPYSKKDWDGDTHEAWQVGYDTERTRLGPRGSCDG